MDAASSGFIGREVAGRYRILAKLGEGGMGSVYRAEQISLKRIVALKVLRPELSAEPGMVRRFNAEAELAAKLSHPNTVTLFDFGQDTDGALFIAMEYLEGRSLREVLMREGALEAGRTLAICEQLCASLADAHQRGIVHRDLKPDNVMLVQRGRQADIVRVLDFGIAKLRDEQGGITARPMTRAGDLIGTPQYMAPEQIRCETVDARTDVYALGAMLYEMVTGRLPFEAPSLMAILSKHLAEMPVSPRERRPDLHIAPGLSQLVMDALQKDPALRPPTMEAFADRLARLVMEVGTPTKRPLTGPPSGAGSYPSGPLADSPPPGVPLLRTPLPGSIPPVDHPGHPWAAPYASPSGLAAPHASGPPAAYSSPAPGFLAPHASPPHPPTPAGPYSPPFGGAMPSPAPVAEGYRHPVVLSPPQPSRRAVWIGLGLCAVAAAGGVAVFFAVREEARPVATADSPLHIPGDPSPTSGTTGTVVPDFSLKPDRQLYDSNPGQPSNPGHQPSDYGQPGVGVWEGGWWRDSSGALELDIPRGFSASPGGMEGAAIFAGDCGAPCTILTIGTSTYGLEVNDDMIAQIIAQLPMKLGQTGHATTVRVQGRDRYSVLVDSDTDGMRGQLVVLHGSGHLAMVVIQAPAASFDHTAGFRRSFFEKRVRFRGP